MPSSSSQTRQFLYFLHNSPQVRLRIAADEGKTLLYAGEFFKPIWKELSELKATNPQLADKQLLDERLALIDLGAGAGDLLSWAKTTTQAVAWQPEGFKVWRALSGIFAANARGAVSFYLGSKIDTGKVFLVTELPVLLRNMQIDEITKDFIQYIAHCARTKSSGSINLGLIR